MNTFIKHIATQLSQPLPGAAAQYRMAHAVRKTPQQAPADARRAAVLALFYEKEAQPNVVLIKRVAHPNDKHNGQIGFPGGKQEEEDPDLEHTALRETEEEIGIAMQEITPLGALTPLYIPVSNFLVHPYVGYAQDLPHFRPQITEVESVLEVPFATLQAPATKKLTDIPLNRHITLKNVPYFDVQGHIVWGATAMMLNELLEVVR